MRRDGAMEMIRVYTREQAPDPAQGIYGVLHGAATKRVSGRIDEEYPCRNPKVTGSPDD